MRIVFTGGSGRAGKHCVPYLLSKGHKVLNLDLVKLDHPDVMTLKTDLTDSGQVFNALTSLFSMDEYSLPERPGRPDAVIHFAAYPCNLIVPDNTTFTSNVAQTYNVIEAACKLGIPRIIIASSETVYNVCFTQGDSDYNQFPLDEETYDTNPEDSYACSKLCGERIARSFARRFNTDIYAFRIGNVIIPEDYKKFKQFAEDPASRKRNAWSYIDARDLGQICHLACEKGGLGYQVFNCTNDTATLNEKTGDFLKREFPNVKVTRELGDDEAPLSNKKIKDVLGFKEEHNWRKYA
ncbi:NAD-dependent epimerase/dehydratase-like protein [Kockovaella imperatae]|uniref:NAD-dependent epimerase/dehydratase-like protein n=1 Tax=Kockovaella imperatae TaxID=4999 RepID=A0A1Y1U9G2_9TREE|nr:NAD-dependent epimerase/dehydratase-like protein [Kockovaella imperatae]ORX34670.1 NAD-dependent epimerase/dehydratase-like protein [Kockovaella imperatae]